MLFLAPSDWNLILEFVHMKYFSNSDVGGAGISALVNLFGWRRTLGRLLGGGVIPALPGAYARSSLRLRFL